MVDKIIATCLVKKNRADSYREKADTAKEEIWDTFLKIMPHRARYLRYRQRMKRVLKTF